MTELFNPQHYVQLAIPWQASTAVPVTIFHKNKRYMYSISYTLFTVFLLGGIRRGLGST